MLKVRPQVKILSIVPGTKYLGVALFYGAELRDWRVKCLNANGIENRIKKAKEIVSDFIQRHSSQVLAIKKLDPKRSSKNLNSLARKTKEFAKRKGLTVYQLKLSEIKKPFALGQRINKKTLAELAQLPHEKGKNKSFRKLCSTKPFIYEPFSFSKFKIVTT